MKFGPRRFQAPFETYLDDLLGADGDSFPRVVGCSELAWSNLDSGSPNASKICPAAITTSCRPLARKVTGAAIIFPPVSYDHSSAPVPASSAKNFETSDPNTRPPLVLSNPPISASAIRGDQ